MKRRAALGLLGASGLALAGCAKDPDVIVKSSDGRTLSAGAIDSDPLALLPPHAVGVASLDCRALFASRFGVQLLQVIQARSPLPESAGFDPRRDLDRVYVATYSMQGADVAAVAVGRFRPADIERAAKATPRTKLGFPVVESQYAGRTLYTANDLGFSVLTERTILLGNETGMRRALDRIQDGRVRRELPAWMAEILTTPKAPLAAGADFSAEPLPDAARQEIALLDGLRTAAVVGNFAEPGLHLAGTLSYDEPEAAARGAENVANLRDKLQTYGTLLVLLGIPQPIRKLEARAEGKEAKFVIGVDAGDIAVLLDRAIAYLEAQAPPTEAKP